jgi:hypothetical protein
MTRHLCRAAGPVALATLLATSGCSSRPAPPSVADLDARTDFIFEVTARQQEACDGDPECVKAVQALRLEMLTAAFDMHLERLENYAGATRAGRVTDSD